MVEITIRARMASVVVLRGAGTDCEVLLLRRSQTLVGTWCQVSGGIEDGETAWQAALRELAEETDLRPASLYSADTCEQFYEADRDAILLSPVFVAFVDEDAEVVLNEEHSEYRWVSFEEAIEMVSFGGQRRVLRWIEDEFVRRVPAEYLRIELSSP